MSVAPRFAGVFVALCPLAPAAETSASSSQKPNVNAQEPFVAALNVLCRLYDVIGRSENVQIRVETVGRPFSHEHDQYTRVKIVADVNNPCWINKEEAQEEKAALDVRIAQVLDDWQWGFLYKEGFLGKTILQTLSAFSKGFNRYYQKAPQAGPPLYAPYADWNG